MRGQLRARRAVEIAAAGGHNLLMVGPPGSGQDDAGAAAARAAAPPSQAEALEITRIHSAAGRLPRRRRGCWAGRFGRRTTAPRWRRWSATPRLRPGEVTLAHRGVLFLDELPEFQRPALEALRLPLEDGEVRISRAAGSVLLPARCQIVAAMNPCPCGLYGDPDRECRCSPQRLAAYRTRISGPLLDRFDLRVEVPRAEAHGSAGEGSAVVAPRILRARGLLEQRRPALTDEAEELLGRATAGRSSLAAASTEPAGGADDRRALGRDRGAADDLAEALSYRTDAGG